MAFGDNQKKLLEYRIETYPVPAEWIFETLLNLDEKLVGQSVSIHSIFNPNDTNPSMIIYHDDKTNRYKFRDFSSGKMGEGVELIQLLYGLKTRHEAYEKGLELYKSNEAILFEDRERIKITKEITGYKRRKWNTNDIKYWTAYSIGSKHLEYFNIYPLSHYKLTITEGENIRHKIFEHQLSYGFFNIFGELIKIYNPENKIGKFIKVKDYIQGSDQLQYKADNLLILSGLKDIIAFKLMNIKNIENIAPHSETDMLSAKTMKYYKSRYKNIFTLFDNDDAGIKSAKKYLKTYGIPYIPFDIEKDVARSVKEHGVKNSKIFMKKAFNNMITSLND